MNAQAPSRPGIQAVTIIEVLVACLMIMIAMGGILAMNTRSIHILRSTRQAVATSQMLQQRIEAIRSLPWPQISNSTSLATLLSSPTASEVELADDAFIERLEITVPNPTGEAAEPGAAACRVERQGANVRIIDNADLGAQAILLVSATVQWHSLSGTQLRELRTIVCRNGLTRSGIFGSTLGRPAATP